jgi:phospholipid-translocating ATPase
MAEQEANGNGGIRFQDSGENGVHISKPTNRMRWATTRLNSVKGRNRRSKIMRRLSKGGGSNEKKRDSGGSDSTDSNTKGQTDESQEEEAPGRRIYFNQPLPPELKDENGLPIIRYERNKIRTAKYTPLTFIPKNLYWQFHQIANAFFLLLVILGVRPR